MGEARRRYAAGDGFTRDSIVDSDDPFALSTLLRQDVEPILEGIARDRETMRHGKDKMVARLPMVVVEDLIHRGIYYDQDAFKKWLNSFEAGPWRIWQGRV